MERTMRYRVDKDGEFDCPVCSWPVFAGDPAVHVESDVLEREFVVCGIHCYREEMNTQGSDK